MACFAKDSYMFSLDLRSGYHRVKPKPIARGARKVFREPYVIPVLIGSLYCLCPL